MVNHDYKHENFLFEFASKYVSNIFYLTNQNLFENVWVLFFGTFFLPPLLIDFFFEFPRFWASALFVASIAVTLNPTQILAQFYLDASETNGLSYLVSVQAIMAAGVLHNSNCNKN